MEQSPGKRLAALREHFGLSQRSLAEQLGLSAGLIGSLETDNRSPSRNFLEALRKTYNVSADWLLHGHGDMLLPVETGFRGRVRMIEPPDRDRPAGGDVRYDGTDYAFVQRVALSVSAGSGIESLDGEEAAGAALPISFFHRERLNSDLCFFVKVRGDSMVPTIPDGSHILIHRTEMTLTAPGIYAFSLDGESFVKRLTPGDVLPSGVRASVVILADNPAYPPIVLTGRRLADLRIVGRVRAVFTTL